MEKALVTGGTGFIGHHLVRRLIESGVDVTCLVRSTSRKNHLVELGARLVEGDVTDPGSLEKATAEADVVLHLAGLTKSTSPRRLWEVNEVGTRHLAEACSRSDSPAVFVLVSSLAAAGPLVEGRPRRETDAPSPVSNYGRSKRAGELAAAAYASKLPITVVRPPIVLGEGDTDGLEMFRGIARWNIHLVPGFADPLFSVVHAEDLAAALMLAADRGTRLETPQQGEDDNGSVKGTYFVSADENVSYAELGRMIGRAVGRQRVRVVRSPLAAVWGISAINEGVSRLRRQPHILNLDKAREASAGGWACHDDQLRRDTGFKPAESLQSRLNQTARWYVQEGFLPARRK